MSTLKALALNGAYHLQNNGVVVFPTDTVYGIGASLASPFAIRKLYEVKRRSDDMPTAVLISSIDQIQYLSDQKLSPEAEKILLKFWPGALTILLHRRQDSQYNIGLDLICGDRPKIGIRLPNHALTLQLIELNKNPVVASSANFKGAEPPQSYNQIDPEFLEQVDLAIDHKLGSGTASTVIDLTTTPFTLLRQGEISTVHLQQLREINFTDD